MAPGAKAVTRVVALLLHLLVMAPPPSLQEKQRDVTDGRQTLWQARQLLLKEWTRKAHPPTV